MLTDDRMLNLAKLMDVAALRGRVHAHNIANQNTRVQDPGGGQRAFTEAMDRRGDAPPA